MGQMLSRCRSSWCSTSYLDDILIIMAREVIRRAFIQVLEVAIRETESKGPFLGVANGSRRDVKRKDPPVAKKPHANRRSADPQIRMAVWRSELLVDRCFLPAKCLGVGEVERSGFGANGCVATAWPAGRSGWKETQTWGNESEKVSKKAIGDCPRWPIGL